jgi:drug/metabolite transporter (DMT)-like permease
MMLRLGLPMIFVFLWSSAFVTGKEAVIYATPFALLLLRFAIVALLFGSMFAVAGRLSKSQKSSPPSQADDWRSILATATVGVLLHGGYLGSVFLALDMGVPAGLTSLIVSMQPLLSSFLAIFLFAEAMRGAQWLGIGLGLAGVTIVLMPTISGAFPVAGLGVALLGLLAITAGTLMQKKTGGKMGLLKSNFIQAAAAAGFYLVITPLLETTQIDWQLPFVLAMSWQILAVSLGAYMILMILIKRDSMAATSSLLFLVPPSTAIMAAIWFGERLTVTSLCGFALASAGVHLVTRYSSPATP